MDIAGVLDIDSVELDLIHGLGGGGESREFHAVGHFFLADCATCIFFIYFYIVLKRY
jgi:hypothetical protein